MKYTIGCEFYKEENEDGPVEKDGELQNLFDGIKLFKNLTCDNIEFVAKTLLENLLKQHPQDIKDRFPKFYQISMTKQFWFHAYTEHNMKDSFECSLEENLDNESGDLIDSKDIYFDSELNVIFNPPERIDFWDSI